MCFGSLVSCGMLHPVLCATSPNAGLVKKKISNMSRKGFPLRAWQAAVSGLKTATMTDDGVGWTDALDAIEAMFLEIGSDTQQVDTTDLEAVTTHNNLVSTKLRAMTEGTSEDIGTAGAVVFMLFAAKLVDGKEAVWDTSDATTSTGKWAFLRKAVGPAFAAYAFTILESINLVYTPDSVVGLRSGYKGGGLTRWFRMSRLMIGSTMDDLKGADSGCAAVQGLIRTNNLGWITSALNASADWNEDSFPGSQ